MPVPETVPVPPLAVTTTLPVPPLHVALVTEDEAESADEGSVIVPDAVAVQPLPSVTV